MKNIIIISLCIIVLMSCTSNNEPFISVDEWGTVDGKPAELYTLTNSNGISAKITNYGGIIVEFNAPDRNGQMANIVLGLSSIDDYLAGHPSLGCIIGRYANRIGGAKFTLDDVEYTLAANNGANHIHGGIKRFSDKLWDAATSNDEQSVSLSLSCTADDMEEGYPGNMKLTVDYVLNNDNELQIHYTAVTDKPTVVNLTNHSYFNLTGCVEDVRNHHVIIYADRYTPKDAESIPTGEIASVEGTPFDLRQWTVISERLSELMSGFDHNFCVGGTPNNPVIVAELYEPQSGRLLQTFSTEPGLQFYTASGLDGSKKSPAGVPYSAFMGACFEAQHYPDSPNKANFPSTVLRPGETYTQTTIYKITVM